MSLAIPVIVLFLALTTVLSAVALVARDVVFRRGSADASPSGRIGRLRPIPAPADGRKDMALPARMGLSFSRLVAETGLDISTITGLLLVILIGVLFGGAMLVGFVDPLAGWAGLAVGMALALLTFIFIRARRLRMLQEQLPVALELLVRAVRAGESIDQAIALAGEEVPHPLGLELRRFSKHLEMGLSVSAAATAMTQRVPLMDARILATTLIVQRGSGGNLAKTLDRLAEVVSDRLNYRRQFRATSAGSRMAAILITSVGCLAILAIWLLEPDYLLRFFDDRAGRTLFATIVSLQAIGIVWVLRLMRSEE